VLWNDIEWPDAGKHELALALAELSSPSCYSCVPDTEHETDGVWEHPRGIGLSFGDNRLQDDVTTSTVTWSCAS
jgi:alpha-L-fucosidase